MKWQRAFLLRNKNVLGTERTGNKRLFAAHCLNCVRCSIIRLKIDYILQEGMTKYEDKYGLFKSQ